MPIEYHIHGHRQTGMNREQFRARAVRAALSTMSDGIVFTNDSQDSYEKNFEQLESVTQQHWLDLSELLEAMLSPIIERLPNSAPRSLTLLSHQAINKLDS
jgi:hypothetical protein